jgi:hypothetical protein
MAGYRTMQNTPHVRYDGKYGNYTVIGSVDGPIEYVFNTIHTHLLSYFTEIQTLDELETCLDEIIADMGHFERYFFHVGFPDN